MNCPADPAENAELLIICVISDIRRKLDLIIFEKQKTRIIYPGFTTIPSNYLLFLSYNFLRMYLNSKASYKPFTSE